jgi:hypothetical protein
MPPRMLFADTFYRTGVSEVLTNDHHFTQEGFTILFPGP